MSFLKLKDTAPAEVKITSSGKKVQKVMEVLLDEYLNPFRMDLDKPKLVNLNSRAPVDYAVAKILLAFVPRSCKTVSIC